MRLTIRWLAPLAAAACVLTLPAASSADSTPQKMRRAVSKGAAFLRTEQQENGGFEEFGAEWALSAFAAAKVAPAEVKKSPTSTDARTWYRELIGDPATWPGSEAPVTDFESAALAAYAAGIDPARVSQQQNLIAQIAAHYDQAAPGYYGSPSTFSGTIFALLALADTNTTAKQRVPQILLDQSVEVIRKNQHTDGGWSYQQAEGNETVKNHASEPDETGAAIAALCGAGVSASDPAIVSAVSYLEGDLKAEASGTGAFASEFGPNTDSNAWAVQGLDACGINPQGSQFTTSNGKTPVDFLISQQLPGGGFAYEPGETSPDFYSSQDATRALGGAGFTAKPVKPAGAPKVLKATEFSSDSSTSSLLTLVVNTNETPLKVCSVSIAPAKPTTTLAAVLEAAQGSATPEGCVTGFSDPGSKKPITQIDSIPDPASTSWLVSIDGGKEQTAKANTTIRLGDTIYLRSTAEPEPTGPETVNVRIEGKNETLFEGPIETNGHDIEASSDTQPRECDSTNNGAHVLPGPTPTAAAVDAMALIGETFDGQWYNGFDDYFITRWGPDAQNENEGAYWGVLVNNVFTSVGGCQYKLKAGDEAMWIYNAFNGRPILQLFAAGYEGAGQPLTATAELGKPFTVEVGKTGEGGEGTPPENGKRGPFVAIEGASVSPVETNAKGFEKVLTSSPATVLTNAQGKASITFTEPGWHRIKATVPGTDGGEETAVRSNRLDVCVPAEGQTGCGAEPAEDQLRVPSYLGG